MSERMPDIDQAVEALRRSAGPSRRSALATGNGSTASEPLTGTAQRSIERAVDATSSAREERR